MIKEIEVGCICISSFFGNPTILLLFIMCLWKVIHFVWIQVGVNGSSRQDIKDVKTTKAPSMLVAFSSDHGTIFAKARSMNLFHVHAF
jgi:hypothetical protein